MSFQEFWHSEIEVYYAYELAYIEKLHETNHLQGYYNYLALQTIFSNMFKKSGEKEEEYPKENLYILYQKERENKTNENNKNSSFNNKQDKDSYIEKKFREQMLMFY